VNFYIFFIINSNIFILIYYFLIFFFLINLILLNELKFQVKGKKINFDFVILATYIEYISKVNFKIILHQ